MSKTLRESLKKTIAGLVAITTIVTLSGIVALAPAAQAAVTIVDGDTVRNPSAAGLAQFDVYIVKLVGTKKFKRLVLNPQVFNSYGHLSWDKIKTVDTATMDSFTTSAIVRVETDPKVLALAPNGDAGSKSWLNVTAGDFVAAGGDWDSVYVINAVDGANYAAAADLTTQAHVSTFLTAGTLPGAPSTATGVTVAVASENQGSTTLTRASVSNNVLSFAITANDGDAILNSVKLKRTGVGLSTDYSSVYIYDGAAKLKSGKSIASDTNTVEFTNIGLALAKGVTKVITVKADVYASAGIGDVNVISIQAASDVTVSAGTVTGTFPVSGNSMSIGSQTIGTTTVANSGSSLSKPVIGQSGAKVASIKLTAGVNDIELKAVTLVQNGTFTNTNITNLKLKNSVTGDVLATADKMTGEKAVLTLTTTLPITKSQNKTVELYADISGGKTTDTIRFYLEETGDITILDKQFGQNSAITNSFGSAAAYCVGAASNTCPTAGSLQGGTITLSDNGPAAATVAKNTTNVDLFKFNMTSTRNVTIKDYEVTLEQTAWDSATAIGLGGGLDEVAGGEISAAGALTVFDTTINDAANLAVGDIIKITDATQGNLYYVRMTTVSANTTGADCAGTVVASVIGGTTTYGATTTAVTLAAGADDWVEIYDTHLRSYVKNVKLVDTDTGNVLASTATSEPFIAFSDDFDFTAGQTRHLAVRADLDNSLVAANAFKAGVDFTVANTIKDNDANQYVSTADVVAGNITGKIMTVGAASLTVGLASTPVTATKVKGAQNISILGIALTAGSSGKAKVSQIVTRLFAQTDGATFTNGEGDVAANTIVETASLYDGDTSTTPLSGPKSLVSVGTIGSNGGYYSATFDNLTYEVPAGTSKKLVLKVNLKNTISAERWLAADVKPSSDVTAQDGDGNALTITGSGISRDDEADTTAVPYFDIKTSGTLSTSVEGSPASAIVVAGKTGVVMAKYKFSALYEGFTLDKLDVASDTDSSFADAPETTNDNDIVQIGVRAGGNTTYSNMSAGKASFSGLNISVPADGNVYVEVLADLNTVANGATSGTTPRLGISQYANSSNTFRAIGLGSSEVKDYNSLPTFSNVADVKAMTLRKTAPTVAKASGLSTSLINGENTFYGFTVAADSGAAVSLKRVALTTSYVADLDISGLKVYRGGSDISGDLTIRNAKGQNLKTGGSYLVNSGTATSDNVYITWDKAAANEEIVSAGTTNTYYLKGTVASAEAADSISMYIADDTVQMADDAVTTLRATTVATNPESTVATPNATGVVLRWEDATHVYVDYNGDGVYTAAADYLITTAAQPTTDTLGTKVADTIIPGNIDFQGNATTATCVDAGDFFFIDTNGGGTYDAAEDYQIVVYNTASTQALCAATAVTLLTYDLKYNSTTADKLFFDIATAGYGVNDDLALAVTKPTSGAAATDALVKSSGANFMWSDNSASSHSTATNDWTNGYLVNDLSTATQTLTY